MTLREAHDAIGRLVVYRPGHVPATQPGEQGVITGVTDRYVFVRYGSDVHSKATVPQHLTLVETSVKAGAVPPLAERRTGPRRQRPGVRNPFNPGS